MTSVYWHGYVSFQKPAAVSAGDWTTAMAAIKTDLEYAPTDGNPSHRWHAVITGDTTHAECLMNIRKLTTTHLSTITGFDMGGAWEAHGINQETSRSVILVHSLIKDRASNIWAYAVFTPASNSMTHVQAAIDLAVANGSGVVDCTGLTVDITKAGHIYSISPTDYGLWVNGNNIWVKGGTFQMVAKPDATSFVMMVFGNGGTGTLEPPYGDGTWCYGNRLIGATFTGTGITQQDRFDIGLLIASPVQFTYCQDFLLDRVTVVDGWNAGLLINTSSRYGALLDCVVNGVDYYTYRPFGIILDGTIYTVVSGCELHANHGINIESNLDNCSYPDTTIGFCHHNSIVGNLILDMASEANGYIIGVGLTLSGTSSTIVQGNTFSNNPDDAWTIEGVQIKPMSYATFGSSPSNDNTIQENTVISNTVNSAYLFDFWGIADLNADGNIIVSGNEITNNTITKFTKKAWFRNALVSGNIIQGNTYDGVVNGYGYDSAGDEAAIVANNSLQ